MCQFVFHRYRHQQPKAHIFFIGDFIRLFKRFSSIKTTLTKEVDSWSVDLNPLFQRIWPNTRKYSNIQIWTRTRCLCSFSPPHTALWFNIHWNLSWNCMELISTSFSLFLHGKITSLINFFYQSSDKNINSTYAMSLTTICNAMNFVKLLKTYWNKSE